MPEADSTDTKQFHPDIPQRHEAFFLKGSGAYDWGMQHRLARIFRPETGRTVMLAIDHGYFQGPTSGLERVDLNILPLVPHADALMLTRGILRSVVPPAIRPAIVVRASGGPSILKELSNEQIAIDVDDAVRLGASAMAVQVFIGGEFETQSVHNLTRLVDQGYRRGIPVLGVTAVGKELVRDARYLGLATRIIAELGAQIVKSREDALRVSAALIGPLHGLRAALPVAGGGMHAGLVPRMVAELGVDWGLAAGGAVHAHPMGTAAGARAIRHAFDASVHGIPLSEARKEHTELAAALDKWPEPDTEDKGR